MAELAPGAEFAGCRIEGVLGRGGMGVVYRATELRLGRPVALKLIAAGADPSARERFEREARAAAAIEHPNVVPVYAAGEEDGHLYLVMRHVPGTDLQALLRREGRLGPGRAADVIAQVADALDAAHAAGLVHRDVKPANVLIAGEHAYLTDFGITRVQSAQTRITSTGEWVGTVDYVSPEQLRGDEVDARSDVYALGCLLHAALTGSPPFRRETVAATISAHLHDPPPRPSETPGVPEAFDAVVARALAKDPDERFASAGSLGRAAIAAATGRPLAPAEDEAPTVRLRAGSPSDAEATAVLPRLPLTLRAPTGPAAGAGEPKRMHRSRGRRRALVATVAALGLPAAAVAAWALSGGGERPANGPLTAEEVRAAAQAFATAYSDEDVTTLRRLLTPGARRVAADGRQDGRPAVVAEYERQFASDRVRRYELSDLRVTAGRVGRAEGRYVVTRAGRPPLRGRVVLGVVRRAGGAAAIALIATEANS
mgnify:CR=1 FL=1|jgi:serine/threonine-protein kinase